MPEILTPSQIDFDTEVAVKRDDQDSDYSGWFCVKTDPWPCPAQGCGFVAHHMTGAHLVIAWPTLDDPQLLSAAHSAQSIGRRPRVVEYEQSFGPCISWDEFERLGRPVHGIASKPDHFQPMRRL